MSVANADYTSNGAVREYSFEQLKRFYPPVVVNELASHHTRVSYGRDEAIFLQGSPADVGFYVLSGMVKLYCPLSNGNRILLRLVGPGEILGHTDFVDGYGRARQLFEARGHTRCCLALFTRESLRKVAERMDKAILLQHISQLNTGWSAVLHWYAMFLGMSFGERLELSLRDMATRFGVLEQRGILLLPELSHEEMAELIQSSRPMVSRLIAALTDDGSLERRGRQYVLIGANLAKADNHETNGTATNKFSFVTHPLQDLIKWPSRPKN